MDNAHRRFTRGTRWHLEVLTMTTAAMMPALHARAVDFGADPGHRAEQLSWCAQCNWATPACSPGARGAPAGVAPYLRARDPLQLPVRDHPARPAHRPPPSARGFFAAENVPFTPIMAVDAFDMARQLCERNIGASPWSTISPHCGPTERAAPSCPWCRGCTAPPPDVPACLSAVKSGPQLRRCLPVHLAGHAGRAPSLRAGDP